MAKSRIFAVVKSGELRPSTTNKGNVIFKQQAALDLGGTFPLPFELTRPQGQPLAPGEYELDLNCIRLNRFNSLEIDSYAVQLLPLELSEVKKAS